MLCLDKEKVIALAFSQTSRGCFCWSSFTQNSAMCCHLELPLPQTLRLGSCPGQQQSTASQQLHLSKLASWYLEKSCWLSKTLSLAVHLIVQISLCGCNCASPQMLILLHIFSSVFSPTQSFGAQNNHGKISHVEGWCHILLRTGLKKKK